MHSYVCEINEYLIKDAGIQITIMGIENIVVGMHYLFDNLWMIRNNKTCSAINYERIIPVLMYNWCIQHLIEQPQLQKDRI